MLLKKFIEKWIRNVSQRDNQKCEILNIAKSMTKTNQAFIGEQCTRNDDGVVLIVSNKLKKWLAKVIMRSFWT